ncbi:Arginine--tRNA ligase [Dissostichus eleginoides]|uniref:Arginine--tRNA ligase n=1 Tax=Dissostichus eleginoides TaxID=100907 RepID=A0AAD9B422_DISEL|nr:Arginine--tRNA ligase [Dissostichus eleginoides]
MLIHLVRLGGNQTCNSIETLLSAYQSDLDPLFKKLKEEIVAKCHMAPDAKFLVDENSKRHAINPQGNYDTYLEAYYNHRYGRQKAEILQYFLDVRQNLQELVKQKGFFNF